MPYEVKAPWHRQANADLLGNIRRMRRPEKALLRFGAQPGDYLLY